MAKVSKHGKISSHRIIFNMKSHATVSELVKAYDNHVSFCQDKQEQRIFIINALYTANSDIQKQTGRAWRLRN